MKLALFQTQEQLNEWARREVELIRNNGLRIAKEGLERARQTGRDVEWHEGNVKYLERKIRKYERMIK